MPLFVRARACSRYLIPSWWTHANWAFCHKTDKTHQSIKRKLPLAEWEESLSSEKEGNQQTKRARLVDRRTKIDVTSHSHFFLALLFWSADILTHKQWICACHGRRSDGRFGGSGGRGGGGCLEPQNVTFWELFPDTEHVFQDNVTGNFPSRRKWGYDTQEIRASPIP